MTHVGHLVRVWYGNQVLENVPSAKYLRITVTNDFDWGQYINNVISKATKTLGFLRQNLTLIPKETKVAAYKALVRPKLEYAALIWNPHHQTEARWACRRWRKQLRRNAKWPEFQERRQQVSLTFFNKIHNFNLVIMLTRIGTCLRLVEITGVPDPTPFTAYTDRLKFSFPGHLQLGTDLQPKPSLWSPLMGLSPK